MFLSGSRSHLSGLSAAKTTGISASFFSRDIYRTYNSGFCPTPNRGGEAGEGSVGSCSIKIPKWTYHSSAETANLNKTTIMISYERVPREQEGAAVSPGHLAKVVTILENPVILA